MRKYQNRKGRADHSWAWTKRLPSFSVAALVLAPARPAIANDTRLFISAPSLARCAASFGVQLEVMLDMVEDGIAFDGAYTHQNFMLIGTYSLYFGEFYDNLLKQNYIHVYPREIGQWLVEYDETYQHAEPGARDEADDFTKLFQAEVQRSDACIAKWHTNIDAFSDPVIRDSARFADEKIFGKN